MKAEQRERGFGEQRTRSFTLTIPRETELLDDEFLVAYCLESAPELVDGAWALRFRPVRARRGFVEVRGTIWVEAESYQARGLAVEFLRDGERLGQASETFRNVVVPSGVLRLPAEGRIAARPGGAMGLVITGFENTYTRSNYRDFTREVTTEVSGAASTNGAP